MLNEVLNENMVKTQIEKTSWRDVVNECGKILLDENKIKDAYVASMIETVEKMGPYMILLPEIAFFHGVPGANVKEICLSLVTLKEPVYFEEFEGQKIKAAFAFGATDKDSHMSLLSNLALLLQDEEFVSLLKNDGSKEEIMERIANY